MAGHHSEDDRASRYVIRRELRGGLAGRGRTARGGRHCPRCPCRPRTSRASGPASLVRRAAELADLRRRRVDVVGGEVEVGWPGVPAISAAPAFRSPAPSCSPSRACPNPRSSSRRGRSRNRSDVLRRELEHCLRPHRPCLSSLAPSFGTVSSSRRAYSRRGPRYASGDEDARLPFVHKATFASTTAPIHDRPARVA